MKLNRNSAGIAVAVATAMVALNAAAVRADHIPIYSIDGYVDTFRTVDVGESTAFIDPVNNPQPALGPVNPPLIGPIFNGYTVGQVDLTCDGGTETTGCLDAAYWAANRDLRWGVLEMENDMSNPVFVTNGLGESFFPSSFPNNGFTSVTIPHLTQVNRRFVGFQFNINSAGIVLLPGKTYAIAVAIGDEGEFAAQTSVPGEGGFDQFAEYRVLAVATGDYGFSQSTYQLHDAFPFDMEDGAVNVDQLVTSRLIPVVVPEPGAISMLVLGSLILICRRSR